MKKKRKRLGQGYIWFSGSPSYTHVSLAKKPNRCEGNEHVQINTHGLGAWKKVTLYAEYTE